jgi:hypothetical protein
VKREEATALLKEIISVCDGLAETAVILMPPNTDDVLSHGYQLHIKTQTVQQTLPCVKPLILKHNLAIADDTDKGLMVIYRPITK